MSTSTEEIFISLEDAKDTCYRCWFMAVENSIGICCSVGFSDIEHQSGDIYESTTI